MLSANLLISSGVGCVIDMSGKATAAGGADLDGFDGKAKTYSAPVCGDMSKDPKNKKVKKLSLAAPDATNAANGVFIVWEDNKITVGVAIAGAFIVSDHFGGCDLTVLRNPNGDIYGAHVHSDKDLRARIATPPAGWKVLGTWKSAGYIEKWKGVGNLLGFAFFEAGKIKFVAAAVKGYPIGQIYKVKLADTVKIPPP